MTPIESKGLQDELAFISKLIYGNWATQITYVFAELGIADVLSRRAKNIDQLAEALNVNGGYLKRYLRCAANLGFLSHNTQTGLYHLSNRGKLLGSEHPESKREEARLNGADYRYQPWGSLLEILKYGMIENFSPTYNKGASVYLKDKPIQLETFHKAMAAISRKENTNIFKDYDFSRFSRVLDIGSGEGGFIKAILDNEPHLHGCMFDLSGFDLPETFDMDKEDKYKGRLIQKQGDFFDEIPDYADLYTMKNILHNWPEDRAIKILENTRDAMLSQKGNKTHPIQKRLLIIENLLTETNDYNVANWMDLNFMILLDGAERTLKEYECLADKCGFSLKNSIKTTSGRHILEFSLTHWQRA